MTLVKYEIASCKFSPVKSVNWKSMSLTQQSTIIIIIIIL